MADVACGRCHVVLTEERAERCWYCEARLCVDCWDAYGHCGHPEADKANEEARKKYDTNGV